MDMAEATAQAEVYDSDGLSDLRAAFAICLQAVPVAHHVAAELAGLTHPASPSPVRWRSRSPPLAWIRCVGHGVTRIRGAHQRGSCEKAWNCPAIDQD